MSRRNIFLMVEWHDRSYLCINKTGFCLQKIIFAKIPFFIFLLLLHQADTTKHFKKQSTKPFPTMYIGVGFHSNRMHVYCTCICILVFYMEQLPILSPQPSDWVTPLNETCTSYTGLPIMTIKDQQIKVWTHIKKKKILSSPFTNHETKTRLAHTNDRYNLSKINDKLFIAFKSPNNIPFLSCSTELRRLILNWIYIESSSEMSSETAFQL